MFSIIATNSRVESSSKCIHKKSELVTSLCVPGDSEGDEEETTQDEVSSHTSEEDGGVVKVEKELDSVEQPAGGPEVVEHEASDKWLESGNPLTLCSVLSLSSACNSLASDGLLGLHMKPLFCHSAC